MRLTFAERERLTDVLVKHGMDNTHAGHEEWDCRDEVAAVVEDIIGKRMKDIRFHLGEALAVVRT